MITAGMVNDETWILSLDGSGTCIIVGIGGIRYDKNKRSVKWAYKWTSMVLSRPGAVTRGQQYTSLVTLRTGL